MKRKPRNRNRKATSPAGKLARVDSTRLFGAGTVTRQVGNVALCCMAPDYRDCLDAAMEGWKKHKATLPKRLMGKQYRPGVYAFAYWLIRWSGLVTPAAPNDQVERRAPSTFAPTPGSAPKKGKL